MHSVLSLRSLGEISAKRARGSRQLISPHEGLCIMDAAGRIAMAQTLSEPALHAERLEASPRNRRWARWLKYLLLFVIFLWAVDFGISLLIRHTRLQKKLTARLESAFGRSVEVGRYNFSLWGGPRSKPSPSRSAKIPASATNIFCGRSRSRFGCAGRASFAATCSSAPSRRCPA